MNTPELRRTWNDPEERIRLLMVTNERVEGTEYGFRDEFARLHREGVLADYRSIAPRADAADGKDWYPEALRVIHEMRPNVLLVLSPGQHPFHSHQIRQMLEISVPTVLYWEGDAWGRGKPITTPMRRWAEHTDVLFTVSGALTLDSFGRSVPRSIRQVAQTYCHVQFAAVEDVPPGLAAPADDVAMIGSSVARLGLVSRVPGGVQRARLVRRLQRLDAGAAIYGHGWRGEGARGPVAYPDQIERLRAARISVNWDHFPRHVHYVSDRLPISLLAGRVHVTTRHPGTPLYRTEGLVEVADVAEALQNVRRLMGLPWEELQALGASAWAYARHRLSDREAARFMLRSVDRRVPAPPADPWERIEALVQDRGALSMAARRPDAAQQAAQR